MNKFQNKLAEVTRKIVSGMAEDESREWPPTCLILAYQPIRPCKISDNQLTDDIDLTNFAKQK